MNFSKQTYWINFVEKLSSDNDLDVMIPSILEDLCKSFGFGCGFVYESAPQKGYTLRASYKIYADFPLSEHIHLSQALGNELIQELQQSLFLNFLDYSSAKTDLEKCIGDLFHAKSMILVPVVGKDSKIIAFVGLADRRKKKKYCCSIERRSSSYFDDDIVFIRSIISILANYIKMQLYRRQAENAQFSLEGTLNNMGIDVYVNDFETHEILYLNKSMAAPYGTVEDILGKVCWQVLYSDKTEECDFCPQKKLIDEQGNPTKIYSWDYQRPFDGAWFRVFSAAFRWIDGRMAHIVSSVDITENKRNEEIIRQLAEYDILTGLPNRYSLTRYIDATISQIHKDANEYYVVFCDLDGFKQVNDTLGHKSGDELLRKIGIKLQQNPLTSGHSYRYGGDEFVIIVDKDTPGTIEDVTTFLRDVFSMPWILEDGSVEIGISMGISHFPYDDDKTGELIRKADQAMYTSKHSGKGKTFYYSNGNISSERNY